MFSPEMSTRRWLALTTIVCLLVGLGGMVGKANVHEVTGSIVGTIADPSGAHQWRERRRRHRSTFLAHALVELE